MILPLILLEMVKQFRRPNLQARIAVLKRSSLDYGLTQGWNLSKRTRCTLFEAVFYCLVFCSATIVIVANFRDKSAGRGLNTGLVIQFGGVLSTILLVDRRKPFRWHSPILFQVVHHLLVGSASPHKSFLILYDYHLGLMRFKCFWIFLDNQLSFLFIFRIGPSLCTYLAINCIKIFI